MCILLRLSTLVLSSVCILCCTGLMQGTADRLGVRVGSIAALCPLLAAASAFYPTITGRITLSMGVCLLLLFGVLLCRDGMACAISFLFAACAGATGFVLCRTFAGFYEPGVLIAAPAGIAAAALLPRRRVALLCTISAPVFYALCVLLEGYYLFETMTLNLAAVEVFDAQTAGCALLFFLWWVFERKIRPVPIRQ